MIENNKTINEVIFEEVSDYYKNNRLEYDAFNRRLLYVKRICDKSMSYSYATGMIISNEQSELFCESKEKLNEAKKQCTKELKSIVKNVKKRCL